MLKKIDKQLTKKVLVFFLVFLGLVLYLNSFFNEFVWDDDDILRNVYLKDWRNLPQYFTQSLISGTGQPSNYWRPLVLISFSIDWRIAQYKPLFYHFHNTFLHIMAAILLFFVIFELSGRKFFSFLASLVFLIHPLQTEAVTYIAGRADSLSSVFIFLSLFLFIKSLRPGQKINLIKYSLSLLSFVFALLSRETAMMTPFLALLVIISFPEKFFSNDVLIKPRRTRIKEAVFLIIKWLLPFFIIFAIFVSLRLTVLNFLNILNFWPVENEYTRNISFRIYTFFRTFLTYIGIFFWPTNLHMERSVLLQTNLFTFPVVSGIIVFLGMIVFAVSDLLKKFPKNAIFFFGIGWFLITLAPYSNIFIPVNAIIYEHWMYLPLIGLSVLSFKTVEDFIKDRNSIFKKLAVLLLIFYFGFFCITTILRNREWRDPIIFYNQILKYNKTYRIYNNLGNAYLDIGDHNKAEESYKAAIAIDPSFPQPEAYNNLGLLYLKQKKYDDAIVYFEQTLKIKENYLPTIINLGDTYQKKKNWSKAGDYFLLYAKLAPYNFYGYYKAGEMSFLDKKCSEAIQYLIVAREIAPSTDIETKNAIALLMGEANKCAK